MKMAWICHLGMEDCLNGHAFKMPALSNHDQNNLISESQNNGGSQVEVQSRSSSEFLYHINHPEDVGAVVTSFCKVIQVCLLKVYIFYWKTTLIGKVIGKKGLPFVFNTIWKPVFLILSLYDSIFLYHTNHPWW